MVREHLVVSGRVHDRLAGSEKLQANQESENPPQKEERQNGTQVHESDPFVIESEYPRGNALGVGEVIDLRGVPIKASIVYGRGAHT